MTYRLSRRFGSNRSVIDEIEDELEDLNYQARTWRQSYQVAEQDNVLLRTILKSSVATIIKLENQIDHLARQLAESKAKNVEMQQKMDQTRELQDTIDKFREAAKQPGFAESMTEILVHLDRFPAFLASLSKNDDKIKAETKAETKIETKIETKTDKVKEKPAEVETPVVVATKPLVRSPEMDFVDHTKYSIIDSITITDSF